jgi:hypothetical protein
MAIRQPKLGGTTDQSVRPNWDERSILLSTREIASEDNNMKTKTKLINPHGIATETSDQSQIRLQEQFIKQVKDDSLLAVQVLTERKDHKQKEDRATDDSAPLFVP